MKDLEAFTVQILNVKDMMVGEQAQEMQDKNI